MSVLYKAWSGMGVWIPSNRLYVPREVKAFEHNFPVEVRYHPQTGKALWRTVNFPIPEFNEETNNLGKYDIFRDYRHELAYCTFFSTYSDEYSPNKISNIPEDIGPKKEEMREFLSKLGLWDEIRFGHHIVLYWS